MHLQSVTIAFKLAPIKTFDAFLRSSGRWPNRKSRLQPFFMPGATPEQMRWFNDLQRVSTSPENAVKFQIETGKIDVLDLLPNVGVPTLVLHCRDDAVVPFEEGRRLAALIPKAPF